MKVSGPGVIYESSPGPDAEVSQVEIRGSIPKGESFSVTLGEGDDTDEGGASAEGPNGTPAVVQPAPSSPESGADQPEEDRPASPDTPTAAAIEDVLRVLEAVRAENDPWRDFALAIMDRLLGAEPATPAPEPEPEPVAFVGPPTPPGHDPELAAILREDEGERLEPYQDLFGHWHIGVGRRIDEAESQRMFVEDMTEAESTARRVLGAEAFDGLGRWRRNAWIVACYWGGCGSYDEMRTATLAGDWEKAAREAQTKALPTSWAAINPERAAELAHWLLTGSR